MARKASSSSATRMVIPELASPGVRLVDDGGEVGVPDAATSPDGRGAAELERRWSYSRRLASRPMAAYASVALEEIACIRFS
jgi:hypothetical protein